MSDLYKKNLDDDEDGEDFVEGDGEEEDDEGKFPAILKILCADHFIFECLVLLWHTASIWRLRWRFRMH